MSWTVPSKKSMVLFFLVLTAFSLVYSPFLLSDGFIGLSALAFFKWKNAKGQLSFMPDVERFRILSPLRPHFPVLSFVLVFAVVLWAGWPVRDWDFWFDRLRMKAPFLVLPFTFILLPEIPRREYLGVLYFFVVILFLTCIGVGINYLNHFDEINIALKEGRSIPVPRHHIRFSVLMSIGIVAGLYLYREGFYLFRQWERKLVGGMTLFLFVFIHVLSVRSGLAALYFALFVLLVRYILMKRKYLIGLGLAAALLAVPFMAYKTVSSFQAKVDYMRYDWYMFRQGEGGINSDSGRFASLAAGWDIFRKHPLAGVGAANLRVEVRDYIEKHYPGFEVHMPPNQFLYVMSGTGLIGLAVFIFGFFYPLMIRTMRRDLFFLGLYAILLMNMMTDHSMEASMSVGMACFFSLVGLKRGRVREGEGLREGERG